MFSYSYEPIFPLKVIKPNNSFGQRATYLHSKMYIIDEHIAYLGSLNFTLGGTENNHETRIRISDSGTVQQIVEEFRYLMDDDSFPTMKWQAWGSKAFKEPKN
ncbi:phospholipase D family protein [Muricauda sp. 334s03]|uniref:Phospholipase D family protein n=1 Tax=Flagellimonas yonaguniensis TaxID=3031325 RepID=A0ABT5Y0I7_9FLAO|nr:phospholipase D family protein [[Muricauda] yonaguniensis]MDF0716960.1 phospholipase D family protein [[Muricauda] yonaguniensis]